MRRTSCLAFNLSWPVWVKAFLGEEMVDAVIERMGAFEKHSVAYLSIRMLPVSQPIYT